MRTATLALFAALLAAALAAASPALADDGYKKNVPEDLRDLVGKKQYEGILKALEPYAGKYGMNKKTARRIAASPCGPSISTLVVDFHETEDVAPALTLVAAGMQDLPGDYHRVNPWKGAAGGAELLGRMVTYFLDWCIFLPEIEGDADNGLAYIQGFAWFYYHNKAGQDFVQGRNPLDPTRKMEAGLKFTHDFSTERGKFMDSPASKKYVDQWWNDPRIEKEDYYYPKGGFKNWNQFFARNIKVDKANQTIPSRPESMPDKDYTVVSPTDCIMNPLVQVLTMDQTTHRRIVENPLEWDTVLDVKGIPIALNRLLGSAPEDIKRKFVGGTGLSCVLMPNTYHHFHSPVNGTVIHKEVVETGTYGYIDFPNWVPLDGNVGRPGTDFSQFQMFERGVIVIEVTYEGLDKKPITGWVASIPVGLDTIGSVVLNDEVAVGSVVKRGYTRLGNFYYGGSLDILLFSKGLASGAVQTRLGNQITLFNVGETPAPKPPMPLP